MTRRASCWNCTNPIADDDFGRQDTCQSCGRDTKVCKNCDFYDVSAYNECKENQAERVVEKEKSNFCDYFRPLRGVRSNNGQKDAFAAAEALFKKD